MTVLRVRNTTRSTSPSSARTAYGKRINRVREADKSGARSVGLLRCLEPANFPPDRELNPPCRQFKSSTPKPSGPASRPWWVRSRRGRKPTERLLKQPGTQSPRGPASPSPDADLTRLGEQESPADGRSDQRSVAGLRPTFVRVGAMLSSG